MSISRYDSYDCDTEIKTKLVNSLRESIPCSQQTNCNKEKYGELGKTILVYQASLFRIYWLQSQKGLIELQEDISNESKGKKLFKNRPRTASFLHYLWSDKVTFIQRPSILLFVTVSLLENSAILQNSHKIFIKQKDQNQLDMFVCQEIQVGTYQPQLANLTSTLKQKNPRKLS